MKKFENLTRREFEAGYISSFKIDDDNRALIWMDCGVYQVGGFHNGVHFRTSHRLKSDAYKSANRVK